MSHPSSSLPFPPTVRLTTGRCFWATCTCTAGSFDAPSGDPASLECNTCGHYFKRHTLETQRTPSVPERKKLPEHWCRRDQLVESIFDRMMHYRILHIRGTPASGKTVLLQLLRYHIKSIKPDWNVSVVVDWPSTLDNDDSGTITHLERVLNLRRDDFLAAQDTVLLLDEAQTTYKNRYFWNMFLKSIERISGVYVVLFSSYGSPKRQPVDLIGLTPPVLTADQRIGLQIDENQGFPPAGLLLTITEAESIMSLASSAHQDHPQFSHGLLHWVYALTAGHVGAFVGILDMIIRSPDLRQILKTRVKITPEIASSLLFQDMSGKALCSTLCQLPFGRGLPGSSDLQDPPTAWVLKTLALNEVMEDNDLHIFKGEKYRLHHQALLKCYTMGFVHTMLENINSETVIYVFPSPIHSWYAKSTLLPPTTDTTVVSSIYTSPFTLVVPIVRGFKPSQLSDPLRNLPRHGTRFQKPPESPYAMEFYRCGHELLEGNILPSQEFGTSAAGGGMIDFFFSEYGWGFELTRDGSNLKAHWDRFMPGGQYHKWVLSGELKDWLLLDFRTNLPREPHPDMERLYHICFGESFRHVSVLDHNLKWVEEFSLLEK